MHRDVVLRVLQLQVICRLLSCCGSAGGCDAQTSGEEKKKQRGKADASGKHVKLVKKEVRSLLDRIALLIDAANPPSLTDEDERSPFHEFLQDVLAKSFAKRVPRMFKFLLAAYELEDESRELERLPPHPLPQLKIPAIRSVSEPQAVAAAPPVSHSILSALRDEQRPLKRSRTETEVPFKKMQLPNELKRRSSFPSTRRDLLNAVAKTSATASSSSSRKSTPRSKDSKASSTPRDSKNASKSAEKPRSGSSNSSTSAVQSLQAAKTTPLLVRAVTGPQSRFTPGASTLPRRTSISQGVRPLFAPRTSLHGQNSSHAFKLGPHPTALTKKPATAVAAPRTAVSTLINSERASVVMRTPDRPRRRPQREKRVMIESSPPFRNPNVGGAAARQRKQPTSIPPPLLR